MGFELKGKRILWLAITAGIASAALAADPSLSAPARQALEAWLETDCTTGERPGVLGARLAEHREELEPALAQLLIGGPDAIVLDAFSERASQRWALRQESLDGPLPPGLDPQAIANLLAEDHESYVERETARFVSVCSERAIAGLAVIRTASARERLVAARDLVDPELEALIDEALQSIDAAAVARPGTRRYGRPDSGRTPR